MPVTPNMAGFAAAQTRKRKELGVDVDFVIPGIPTWDPAEPLDPETGRPYDPFATPAGGTAVRVVTVRVVVIDSLGGGQDETVVSAAGRMSTDELVLSLEPADYATVTDATHAVVHGQRWKVTEARRQRIRVLVFCGRA